MISVCGCMIPTERGRIRSFLTVAAALALSAPAYAQLCSDSGGGGNLDCDNSYRDTVLTCTDTYTARDKDGKTLTLPSMFPACPSEPMPMRDTERLSFIKDFSPYLYDYARDPDDATRPYSGYIARGTKGDPSQTFAAIGNAPVGVNRQKGCVNQIDLSVGDTPAERAKLIRLQLDNCANQFILNSAPYPFHKAGSNLICATADNASRRCTQEDLCQPLRMRTDPKQEYQANTYIKAAWKKLLQTPSYRKTEDAPNEPHLPDGITLSNPIEPSPATDSTITLSGIAATEYEEIIDPSHPFSPRWDYKYNERDYYSPKTSTYMSKFHNDSKAVYCAGNRGDSGDKTRDKNTKVDVLEFRREKFDKGTTNRINYNTACYNDRGSETVKMLLPPYILGASASTPQFLKMAAGAYCYKITRPPIPQTPATAGYPGDAERLPCWQCYGLNGKVSDEGKGQLPPCTTRYDSADQKMISKKGSAPVFPGGKNSYKREAVCTANFAEKKTPMSTLCKDLRAPYVPLNKLKMRYHNPEGTAADKGGPENLVLKGGVQEGLWHKEYFEDHMPYPRLWDVGSSIQRTSATDQDPNDNFGQFTAIVGVGREGKVGSGEGTDDQRCMYGGWGGDVSIGRVNIQVPDPITSWTELKLYQAYTTRETNGIICLGRYEKAFKHRSPENQQLVAGGAVRTGIIRQKCALNDKNRTTDCQSQEIGEETADGADDSSKDWESLQYIQDNMPLAWRGYMGPRDASQSFAQLTGGKGLITGLDNAHCGDFILMPYGGGTEGDASTRGLPKLARVECPSGKKLPGQESAVRTLDGKHYIEVKEADNGKWPDVCGTTDVMGELKTRKLFKPGEMRKVVESELKRLNWTTSCADTKLTECEMQPWSTLKLYRPVSDVLKGTSGEATK